MDELLSKKEKYTLVSQETVFETGLVSKILDSGTKKQDMVDSKDQCKRQEDSEPSAEAKLSHLLAFQTIRTLGPVFVNSDESESSRPPS